MATKSKSNAPRDVRNNNPGNIRHGIQWKGMAANQPDPQFVTFSSPKWGFRAMVRIIWDYWKVHGLTTVRGIINRWAPPSENNTPAYVKFVADYIGVSPDKPLRLNAGSEQLVKLIDAIATYESGSSKYWTVSQIESGIQAA